MCMLLLLSRLWWLLMLLPPTLLKRVHTDMSSSRGYCVLLESAWGLLGSCRIQQLLAVLLRLTSFIGKCKHTRWCRKSTDLPGLILVCRKDSVVVLLLCSPTSFDRLWIFADRVSGEGNAIGCVRHSVCFHCGFWTIWPFTSIFACIWVMMTARGGLKVEVIGQGRGLSRVSKV